MKKVPMLESNVGRWVERACWMVATCAALVIAAEMMKESEGAESGAELSESVPSSPGATRVPSADSLLAWASLVAERPPFRLDRRPADDSPPQEALTDEVPVTFPVVERPLFTLRGTVGKGGRWEAVLSGVPGREGDYLVRLGDTLPGGLHVASIAAESVRIVAPDTAWHLTTRTWQ